MTFDKQAGRMRITVCRDGLRQHEYRYGVKIWCDEDALDMVSVEDLRDLRYVVERALEAAQKQAL